MQLITSVRDDADRFRVCGQVVVRTSSSWLEFGREDSRQVVNLVRPLPDGLSHRTFLVSCDGWLYTDAAAETVVELVEAYDGYFRCSELGT
ncbi:MAG TPA: hypothetical protein VGE02_09435 [Gemmatimonadales bacterium]